MLVMRRCSVLGGDTVSPNREGRTSRVSTPPPSILEEVNQFSSLHSPRYGRKWGTSEGLGPQGGWVLSDRIPPETNSRV